MPRDDLEPVRAAREALERDARGVERSAGELDATVTELAARRPTAAIELTEAELEWVVEELGATPGFRRPAHEDSAYSKLLQALKVEQGPGGSFAGPPERAA